MEDGKDDKKLSNFFAKKKKKTSKTKSQKSEKVQVEKKQQPSIETKEIVETKWRESAEPAKKNIIQTKGKALSDIGELALDSDNSEEERENLDKSKFHWARKSSKKKTTTSNEPQANLKLDNQRQFPTLSSEKPAPASTLQHKKVKTTSVVTKNAWSSFAAEEDSEEEEEDDKKIEEKSVDEKHVDEKPVDEKPVDAPIEEKTEEVVVNRFAGMKKKKKKSTATPL